MGPHSVGHPLSPLSKGLIDHVAQPSGHFSVLSHQQHWLTPVFFLCRLPCHPGHYLNCATVGPQIFHPVQFNFASFPQWNCLESRVACFYCQSPYQLLLEAFFHLAHSILRPEMASTPGASLAPLASQHICDTHYVSLLFCILVARSYPLTKIGAQRAWYLLPLSLTPNSINVD